MAKTKYDEKTKATGPKAKNDAYVMMLFITLVAIITGSVLMYLDNDEYGKTPPPKEVTPSPPRLGDTTAPVGGTPTGEGKNITPPKGDGKDME